MGRARRGQDRVARRHRGKRRCSGIVRHRRHQLHAVGPHQRQVFHLARQHRRGPGIEAVVLGANADLVPRIARAGALWIGPWSAR
jgi:hypothetical protein